MSFSLDHWKNPREKIATKFHNNDFGYVLHGALQAWELLRAMNYNFKSDCDLSVLDYGCGTGRVSRILAFYFKQVDGYDPVKECIIESEREALKAQGITKKPRLLTCELSELTDVYDLVLCANVLEHLNPEEFQTALANISNLLLEGGVCYLWAHKILNSYFFDEHQLDMPSANIAIIKGFKVNGLLRYQTT